MAIANPHPALHGAW